MMTESTPDGNGDLKARLKAVLRDVLELGQRAELLDESTPLLGALPELDSIAVIELLSTMEERFGIVIADDEISADTFATFGSLLAYLADKCAGRSHARGAAG